MSFTLKNRCALITGASAGIGKALAERLAAAGCDLLIVARREGVLHELATQWTSTYGVDIQVLALDLATQDAVATLAARAKAMDVSVVINNAGFAVGGRLETQEPQRIQSMLALNMRFLTLFTHAMLPHLLQRQDGGRILNIGSITGYQGVPGMTAYAASKAFVNNFSEGLAWELRKTNVTVGCVEPGQTASEFFEVADMNDAHIANSGLLTPDHVARAAMRALATGRTRTVVGLRNKLLVFSLRLTPRWLVKMVICRLFKDLI